MTSLDYVRAVRRVLDHLESTQLAAIEQAAALVLHALTHRGTVFVDAIGHGNEGDFLNRAGGLAAVKRFSWGLSVSAPMPDCLRGERASGVGTADAEAVRLALRRGNVRAGDVMVVSSVSGKTVRPIELALACRESGVRVVGMTSLAYTRRIDALHPSGKKLCDVVDVVIDIGAPFGDAAVSVPGYECDVLPVSGVGMIVSGWMLWGRVMEEMSAAGDPATVFMSVNRPGGKEFHERALAEYNRKGY